MQANKKEALLPGGDKSCQFELADLPEVVLLVHVVR